MVQAPGTARHGAPAWPSRRTITPGLAGMLAAARRGRGWSVREAARRARCSPGMIVHLEKARRAPSTLLAEDIIDGYRLDYRQADLLLAEAVDDAGRSWNGPRLPA
jgi:hypothetical protein